MKRNKLKKFVELLEIAIKETELVILKAEDSEKHWMIEDGKTALSIFQSMRKKAIENNLPKSEGAGFGITKALGEWAPEALLDAAHKVENYYMDNL